MLTVLRHDSAMPVLSSCQMATARNCLVHLIERYDPDIVYLPEMCPEGVMDPCVHRNPVYYPLKADLSADLGAIMAMHRHWQSCKRPLFVSIAFFGYHYPLAALVAWAHTINGLVVEDCAHSLVHQASSGTAADLTLFSLNKVLPVPDGAMLLSHTPHVDVTVTDQPEPYDSAVSAAYMMHLHANRLVSLLDPHKDGAALGFARSESRERWMEYYKAITEDMKPHTMSRYAKAAWANIDFKEYVDKRKENARKIMRRLKRRQLFIVDQEPVFALPVLCQNRPRTGERLWLEGIDIATTMLHWRAPQSLEALDFWDRHVMLPIHEKLTDGEVNHIANCARWYV